jgi:hypothetical protein
MNKSLEIFKNANTTVEVVEETEHINLNKLWGDNSFMCRFGKTTDFKSIEDIELPYELSAIFHKSEQRLEFIFAPLSDDHHFLKRKTKFYYKGIEFETEFNEPTEALKILSVGFRKLDSPNDSQYRNLEVFCDFFRTSDQNDQMKNYFKDKKPYSFFVKGDFKKIKNDFVPFCKHLNVYLRFFDRRAPIIAIVNNEPKSESFSIPCYTNKSSFPEQINGNSIDPVAIDLLQVAQETGNGRLKYLFYYQVLEYFAYYYLDEELKRKLSNLLKSPDLLHNSSIYTRTIIEELKDYSNHTSDKQKLTRLLSDYITVDDIANEVKCNIKNFTNDLEFDGHFKLSAIISDEKLFDKLFNDGKESKEKKKERLKSRTDFIISIADRLDNIRNVLVHIRESRENKVILPTRGNNRKLIPYIYLIRRIAETIAIKYEG